jgi:hypothetical protein
MAICIPINIFLPIGPGGFPNLTLLLGGSPEPGWSWTILKRQVQKGTTSRKQEEARENRKNETEMRRLHAEQDSTVPVSYSVKEVLMMRSENNKKKPVMSPTLDCTRAHQPDMNLFQTRQCNWEQLSTNFFTSSCLDRIRSSWKRI